MRKIGLLALFVLLLMASNASAQYTQTIAVATFPATKTLAWDAYTGADHFEVVINSGAAQVVAGTATTTTIGIAAAGSYSIQLCAVNNLNNKGCATLGLTVTVSLPPSPEGTHAPPAAQIVDIQLHVWTVVNDGTHPGFFQFYRDGQPMPNWGRSVELCQGDAWIVGDDPTPSWFHWLGTDFDWNNVLTTDPCPQTVAAPTNLRVS